MRLRMQLTLPRATITVPMVRHLVTSMLERAGVAPRCVDQIKVALTEACTNAYEHAIAGDSYEVIIVLDDQFIAMDVIDRGNGLNGTRRYRDSGDGRPYSENGRGIDLIRALTEATTFDTTASGGTALHMWKRLQWTDHAPWDTPTGSSAHPN